MRSSEWERKETQRDDENSSFRFFLVATYSNLLLPRARRIIIKKKKKEKLRKYSRHDFFTLFPYFLFFILYFSPPRWKKCFFAGFRIYFVFFVFFLFFSCISRVVLGVLTLFWIKKRRGNENYTEVLMIKRKEENLIQNCQHDNLLFTFFFCVRKLIKISSFLSWCAHRALSLLILFLYIFFVNFFSFFLEIFFLDAIPSLIKHFLVNFTIIHCDEILSSLYFLCFNS